MRPTASTVPESNRPARIASRLVVSAKGSPSELRFLVDTARHVLLRQESFDKGKLTGSIAYDDFVEIGGSWWAKRVVSADAEGRKTGATILDVKSHAPQQFDERMRDELAAKPLVQFLHLPCPSLKTARQKVADGSAGFDDRVMMILHFASLQQWDELLAATRRRREVNRRQTGSPLDPHGGIDNNARNEEARQRLLGEARAGEGRSKTARCGANPRQDDKHLADYVLTQAQSVGSPSEYLEFVELLKPVYERQPADLNALAGWQEQLLNVYEQLGRAEERARLATRFSGANALGCVQADRLRPAVVASGPAGSRDPWLQRQLDRTQTQKADGGAPFEWTDSEDESLRTAYASCIASNRAGTTC